MGNCNGHRIVGDLIVCNGGVHPPSRVDGRTMQHESSRSTSKAVVRDNPRVMDDGLDFLRAIAAKTARIAAASRAVRCEATVRQLVHVRAEIRAARASLRRMIGTPR